MTTTSYRPGDVFVETGGGLFDRIVQFGQWWRFRNRVEYRWDHAGVITSEDGSTVEAEASGVGTYKLTPNRNVMVIAIEPEAARTQIVKYARERIGRKYGWFTIACLVLRILPPDRLTFGISGEYVCSGLCAAAMDSAGIDMGDTPEDTYPAQLVEWAYEHEAALLTHTVVS